MASVIYILTLLVLTVCVVTGMYSSKALEGYPAGYMGDCPGSTKPAKITKKSLRYLTITVIGVSPYFRKTKYSYYQMNQLAKDPNIDFKKKTFLYVGGYLDSSNFPMSGVIGAVYKRLGYNVLLLDTNMFTTMMYPRAARYMRPVGLYTAEMLANLTKLGLNPKTLEIVGISLGGHTMSFIAKNYRTLTGTNVSRLTALDPAGPCFRNLGPDERLDQTDADFVDVIITNMDYFGMAAAVGHVNFYINGGEFQPGDVFWMPCDGLCSHIRSYTLWVAALNNPSLFIALKCDSINQARQKQCYNRKPRETNILGLYTKKKKEGIFYLATDNNYPYGLGEKGLEKRNEFFESRLQYYNTDDVIQM